MKKPIEYRYNSTELKEFRAMIEARLTKAKDELRYIESVVSNTVYTDPAAQQLATLASKQGTFIYNLERALDRVNDGTYGVCRVTGNLIDKAHLRAVPHATLSLEGKLLLINQNNKL